MLAIRHTWQTVASALGACIVGYFLFHTVEGERGWLTMLRLQHQVGIEQAELSQLQQEKTALDHRVQLMNPGNLDPDLLDERVRKLLNYSKPNDIIVLTHPEQNEDFPQRSKFKGE